MPEIKAKEPKKSSGPRHFKITLPIIKTKEKINEKTGKKERYIFGVASGLEEDSDGEKMAPSAIKSMADSLKKHAITMNSEHDKSWQSELADIESLKISKTNELLLEAKLNEMSIADDLWYALTKAGKKLGLSIGGYVREFDLEKDDENENKWIRVLKDVELDHVAVVTSPAYPKAWVDAIVKSIDKGAEKSLRIQKGENASELLDELTKSQLQGLVLSLLDKKSDEEQLSILKSKIMSKKASLETDEAKKASEEETSTPKEDKESVALDAEGKEEEKPSDADEKEEDTSTDEEKEEKEDEKKEDSDEESQEDESEEEEKEDDKEKDEDEDKDEEKKAAKKKHKKKEEKSADKDKKESEFNPTGDLEKNLSSGSALVFIAKELNWVVDSFKSADKETSELETIVKTLKDLAAKELKEPESKSKSDDGVKENVLLKKLESMEELMKKQNEEIEALKSEPTTRKGVEIDKGDGDKPDSESEKSEDTEKTIEKAIAKHDKEIPNDPNRFATVQRIRREHGTGLQY